MATRADQCVPSGSWDPVSHTSYHPNRGCSSGWCILPSLPEGRQISSCPTNFISQSTLIQTSVKSETYQVKRTIYRICWYIAAGIPDVDEAVLNRGIGQLFGHLELGLFASGRDVDERDICSRCHNVNRVAEMLG